MEAVIGGFVDVVPQLVVSHFVETDRSTDFLAFDQESTDWQEGGLAGDAARSQMLEIARNFADITDERHQDAVSNLARALAEPR